MTRPSDLIRPEILALSAYHVPPAAGMIKLDAMENPYGLPPALAAELAEQLRAAPINRYPDPSGAIVRSRLAATMGVPEGVDVLLGNGSDELIQLIALAVAKPGAVILGVEPSFVMYRMIATFCGLRYVGVPLREDFSLDLDATLAAIETHRPALTFLAYPNNPTGNRFDQAEVAHIVAAAPGLVVVDEAYHAFATDSFMPRLPDYPNLLVMRTLSKLGLAGLRLGFLAGAPQWLGEIDKLRLPYNINVLTQTAVAFALDHVSVFDAQAAALRVERGALRDGLSALPGVTAYPSEANFILARVPDAPKTHAALRGAGILIKNLHGAHPLLNHCLRFTVGTPDENRRVLDVLPSCL
ncbi:MAG: histidinol-phosphate transaminase [Burkholderiales bacterium]|nr:histidinol-phosphate transaminase [Burkholderiales bacterium]